MRELVRNVIRNEILSAKQAADYLGIDVSGMRKKVRSGKIPFELKGRTQLMDLEDVKRMKEELG